MIKRALVRKKCIDYILDGCAEIIKTRNNIEEMDLEEEEFHLTTRYQYIAQKVFTKIMNEFDTNEDPYL